MSGKSVAVVWFRQDLRLADNPALTAACEECDYVIPVFIDDPMDQSISQVGAASRVWLHHSLLALNASLQKKSSRLAFFKGDSLRVLKQVISHYNATRLYWNRCYDPKTIERDTRIKAELTELQPKTFNALLLFEPWQNLKPDGTPYRVYTPFWKKTSASIAENPKLLRPKVAPSIIPSGDLLDKPCPGSVELSELGLLPDKPWHMSMMEAWRVGEANAIKLLSRFLKQSVFDYDEKRNLPSVEGTSLMSPHLHFGEISPRQILHKLCANQALPDLKKGQETFAKEIVWREFAYSLLYHFPQTIQDPLDSRFHHFPWAENTQEHLIAWQRGKTGVPIVDAGMRQLYQTGWMHNRVRMIVASYLIKNLLIPWQFGEQWFRDTLVDADLASNAMGWQWTAGCGADAAPFFRVFNPVLQGEKFDPDGHYVRRWVPELATLSNKEIHQPWASKQPISESIDYPAPLVDLKATRLRALEAFSAIKGTKTAE